MKILHVLTSPRAEGTPRLALDWFAVKDHEQHVLFLNNNPTDLLEQFQSISNNIRINSKLNNKIYARIYKIPHIVRKACKEVRPDMVVAWNQPNVHLILLGAKMAGVRKLVGHAGCLPEKSAKIGWLYSYFVFFSIWLLRAKVICPSKHILNTFYNIPFFPKSTLKVAPNAINISRFVNASNESIRKEKSAIYVANLESAKDHEILIKAWSEVIKVLPEALLTFAGRGSLETTLKQLSIDLRCDRNIQFLGARNDIPQLLWETELFVFPSKNVEGFGTVLIEALAAGLKIVAFNEPAPKEVLLNGTYGCLVEPRNAKALADAIVNAFNTPLETNNSDDYLKNFSIDNMVKKYIEIAN